MNPASTRPPDAARPPATTPTRRYRRDPAWSNHMDIPEPVRDRRLSGDHWWDPDRIAHAEDAPRFCPSCGGGLDGPGCIAVEYWQSEQRIFHTRCDGCGWSGDIARVDRMVGYEAPHE